MSGIAWLVTSGSYSDYTVLAVAATKEAAEKWAAAYNAARQSLYRDDAEVEEVEIYEDGDPLPRSVTVWNADVTHSWPVTNITTSGPGEPHVTNYGGPRGPFAQNYPTREAAEAAVAEFLDGSR